MICLYKITNTINQKVYIGQTTKIKKRFAEHKRCKRNHPLYNAIKKYGIDNFTFEVLCEIEDQEEANNLEINLIYKYESTNKDKGYNLSPGGLNNIKVSNETRKKISESKKGSKNGMFGATPHNIKLNQEEREIIREMYETGNYTYRQLAKIYDVNPKVIYNIMHNI